MANFAYTYFKSELLKGNVDFDAPDDFRVILVDSTTTADTEEDVTSVDAFTTLGEFSGTGYSRQQLGSDAVTADNTNDRGEYDAADTVWAALNADNGTAQAAIIYKHITTDSDSMPIAYIDTGGFPFVTNGGSLTIQWGADGILQTT